MLGVELTNQTVLLYLAVFLRVGTSFIYMPAIGDANVSPMIRLLLALATTIVVVPYVESYIILATQDGVLILLGQELLIGFSLAILSKIFISAIHLAGMAIGTVMGLSLSVLFDPSQQSQGNTIGNFFTVTIITLLIINNGHFLYLEAIVDSYKNIAFAEITKYQSLVEAMVKTVSHMWQIAIKMSSPFILINVILMFGSGILAKLMPQLQIFFVMVPLQILIGVIVIGVSITGIANWFLEEYGSFILAILT